MEEKREHQDLKKKTSPSYGFNVALLPLFSSLEMILRSGSGNMKHQRNSARQRCGELGAPERARNPPISPELLD